MAKFKLNRQTTVRQRALFSTSPSFLPYPPLSFFSLASPLIIPQLIIFSCFFLRILQYEYSILKIHGFCFAMRFSLSLSLSFSPPPLFPHCEKISFFPPSEKDRRADWILVPPAAQALSPPSRDRRGSGRFSPRCPTSFCQINISLSLNTFFW